MFSPARNDERLNSYSRLVTMAWMANTDVSPCSNSQAVLNYIAKYCTKEEKKTATYADLVKEVLPHLNCAKPLLSLVSKTMNKLIGECDWSAQEVCHLLLNIPPQSGSCTVITLDCLPPGGSTAAFLQVDEAGVRVTSNSVTEKYKQRPLFRSMATLFEFLRDFDHCSYKRRPKIFPA